MKYFVLPPTGYFACTSGTIFLIGLSDNKIGSKNFFLVIINTLLERIIESFGRVSGT